MKRLAALPLALLALLPTTSPAAPAGSTLLVSRPAGLSPLVPGITNNSFTRESPDIGGDSGGGQNVSADGSLIVFVSDADGLSADDDNHFTNCFVRNMTTGTTRLVSRADGAGGAGGAGNCFNPVISGDGTAVAFVTTAGGLDPNVTDVNGARDVYVRDLTNDSTTLVSRANGADIAISSDAPSISTSGDRIAFESVISGLDNTIADGGSWDIFVRNVPAESTVLASRSAAAAANGTSVNAAINGDGLAVAFETDATNLTASDPNSTVDIHVRNLQLDSNIHVSRASGAGVTGDAASSDPAFSADGTRVAFDSAATNLVAGDTNSAGDVFVRTGVDGAEASQTTIRVSLKDDDTQGGNGEHSADPAISANGSVVAYESGISDASIGDDVGFRDIHVRNVAGGTTELASATTGTPGSPPVNDTPSGPSISGNAVHVVFQADFDAASPDDDDDWQQVFHRNLTTDTTQLVSRQTGNSSETGDGMDSSFLSFPGGFRTGQRVISRDGRYVAFTSRADDLVAGQNNALLNAYRRDLATNTTVLVSRASDGTPANADTTEVAISADGSRVAFITGATNVDGGGGGTSDVFLRDLATGTTRLVSRRTGAAGAAADGSASDVSISADGKRVAWATSASNLHPDGPGADVNNVSDVYVRDVPTDTTLYGSAAHDGSLASPAGFGSIRPALDGDGSRVLFDSFAPNLVPGDGNATGDVFVRDLAAGQTILVSRADGQAGAIANGFSGIASIDESGTRVAFGTAATNLAGAEDGNGNDVYVRDLTAGTTELASRKDGTGGVNQNYGAVASNPTISGDGTKVAYTTFFGDVAENDLNGTRDVYVRDVETNQTSLASLPHGSFGATVFGDSSTPSMSLDGNCVAFGSGAEALTSDYPGFDFDQIYVRVLSGECPDATPPDTSIDSGPTGLIGFNQVTFTFSSSEKGATFECRMDDAAFAPCSSAFEVTGIADGAHTFQVRATDQYGNADASPASRSFTVDTTLPDTVIDSGPAANSSDNTPTFAFSANEVAQGFECRLDDAPFEACASPLTVGPVADGSHVFEVRAVDGIGNRDATPATAGFNVDTGPPETTIDSGPSGSVADATPTFEFSASEPGSSFQCRIDDAAFAACAGPFTASTLADGAHTFSVRATDAVGNQDATAATRAFSVDTRGPVIRLRFKKQKLMRAATKGLKGTATASEGCTGRIVALKPFASRPSAFKTTFTLKFKKRARRALLARKRARVSVRARCTDELGNTTTVTRTRRLRR